MCIHRYRVFARFGLTHMIATNLCVWLRTVATEILRELLKPPPSSGAGSNTSAVVTATPQPSAQQGEFQPLYNNHEVEFKYGPNDSGEC